MKLLRHFAAGFSSEELHGLAAVALAVGTTAILAAADWIA